MKIKFLPFASAALTLLFSTAATAVFAQDYEIKLNRPSKAGDEYKVEASGKTVQDMTVTVNGTPQENKKTDVSVALLGTVKVLAVDEKGGETKVSVAIEKFTKTSDGATTDIAAKGAVLNGSSEGKKATFDIDGKSVDAETAELIKVVISLSESKHTDDEMFGTKDHKKKGDVWDANTAAMLEDLQKDTPDMKMENVTGKTTLEDLVGDALKISAHVTGDFKPPLPPMFTIDHSAFDVNFSGLFPTDLSKPRAEESLAMTFSFTGHADAPSGEKILMKMNMVRSAQRKMTPIK